MGIIRCAAGIPTLARCCSGRHRGLPLRLGVSYIPFVTSVLYVFSISHLFRVSRMSLLFLQNYLAISIEKCIFAENYESLTKHHA